MEACRVHEGSISGMHYTQSIPDDATESSAKLVHCSAKDSGFVAKVMGSGCEQSLFQTPLRMNGNGYSWSIPLPLDLSQCKACTAPISCVIASKLTFHARCSLLSSSSLAFRALLSCRTLQRDTTTAKRLIANVARYASL